MLERKKWLGFIVLPHVGMLCVLNRYASEHRAHTHRHPVSQSASKISNSWTHDVELRSMRLWNAKIYATKWTNLMRVYTQTNYQCNYLSRFALSRRRDGCVKPNGMSELRELVCVCVCVRTHCFINHQSQFHFTMWGECNSKLHCFSIATTTAAVPMQTTAESYTLLYCFNYFHSSTTALFMPL